MDKKTLKFLEDFVKIITVFLIVYDVVFFILSGFEIWSLFKTEVILGVALLGIFWKLLHGGKIVLDQKDEKIEEDDGKTPRIKYTFKK